jgi:hypothetical protein
MKYLILLACLVGSLIQLNQAQQTICSAYETNVDYKGNDLTFTYDAKNAQECSNLCSKLYQSCTGFTFWSASPKGKICFLKNFTSTPARLPSQGRKFKIFIFKFYLLIL